MSEKIQFSIEIQKNEFIIIYINFNTTKIYTKISISNFNINIKNNVYNINKVKKFIIYILFNKKNNIKIFNFVNFYIFIMFFVKII